MSCKPDVLFLFDVDGTISGARKVSKYNDNLQNKIDYKLHYMQL